MSQSASKSALRAGLAAVAGLALAAGSVCAQPMSGPPVGRPGQVITCPAQIQVVMKPTVNPVPGGWTDKAQVFPVTLDPLNLPRVEMGTLICYYQALKQPGAFVIYQPTGARTCVVRPDKKSFACT